MFFLPLEDKRAGTGDLNVDFIALAYLQRVHDRTGKFDGQTIVPPQDLHTRLRLSHFNDCTILRAQALFIDRSLPNV